MSHESLQLRIATKILAAIISQDRNRELADRQDDIAHSFEVANELIRRCAQVPPSGDLMLEPTPQPQPATREAVVQRDTTPMSELLADRRGPAVSRKKVGPTYH